MNKKSKFRDDDKWEKWGDEVPSSIKNWVASKQVDTKHPAKKMIEREQAKGGNVPHMDQGGMVPDDMRRFLEPQGAGIIAPSAFPPPSPVSVAPAAPVAPVAAPIAPEPPPVASPVAAQPPAPPTDFNAEADKIMGGTPEQRQAEFQSTQAPRAVNVLSSLGAGLGDAIARSYGQDSGAHHQEILQGNIQAKNQALLENQKNQAAFGKERFGIEQTLEAKNPTSPLSQSVQKSYGPLLLKIGFKPQDVMKMSAANISDLTGKSVDVLKAEAEAAMAGATFGLKKVEGESSIMHQRSEEERLKREQGFKEDQEAQKHWIKHPINAGKAGNRLSEGSSGEGGQSVMTATNPQTGHKLKSYDGGKTWE